MINRSILFPINLQPTHRLRAAFPFSQTWPRRSAWSSPTRTGPTARLLMVESIGGGCGWVDLDRDGAWDVWLTQGGRADATSPTDRPSDVLFRQTGGEFVAVTGPARCREHGYSQGISIGDYDGDGFDDVYVTNVGQNSLWRNMGDGTFINVEDAMGGPDDRWSSSAAWADLDADGDLDLYVCNYLQYDPYDPLVCEKDGLPALCHPRQLSAWPDDCFENLGDGRFRRVAGAWGLSGPGNKALGVAIADFNNDSRPDIYVANDTTANFLFVNREPGIFEESAIRLGCALSAAGEAQASMGIGVADYDENGMLDVLLTHFTGEANTLYQNLGDYGIHDVSGETGVRTASWSKLGFGAILHDFDQNGTPEMLIANGHIDERNADGDGYRQQPQLLTWDGNQWSDVTDVAGAYFQRQYVGRGMGGCDFDSDGDWDVLVVHQNDAAALLRNDSPRGHWLKLNFVGTHSNRRGIGCRVIARYRDRTITSELIGGSSFASSHEPALLFGLGDWDGMVTLEVVWPSGRRQTLDAVPTNQTLTILETEHDDGTGVE